MDAKLFIFFCGFLLTGCSAVPPEPYSQTAVNTSSNNLTMENATLPQPQNKTRVDEQSQRLKAKGGGIFDFGTLTSVNCDEQILSYRQLLDDAEDELDDLEEELEEERRDLQKAQAALAAARQKGDTRAIDRASEDIDDEEEDVTYVEDLLEEKTEHFRKLKIVFATMKEECPKLKARA